MMSYIDEPLVALVLKAVYIVFSVAIVKTDFPSPIVFVLTSSLSHIHIKAEFETGGFHKATIHTLLGLHLKLRFHMYAVHNSLHESRCYSDTSFVPFVIAVYIHKSFYVVCT